MLDIDAYYKMSSSLKFLLKLLVKIFSARNIELIGIEKRRERNREFLKEFVGKLTIFSPQLR